MTPDASTDCTTVAPVTPSPSMLVNGALCFGIARGDSQALQCAPGAAPDVVDCVDNLIGDAFVVRWTGNRALVFAGLAGVEIGSVTPSAPNTFQIATATKITGQCTMQPGPPPRADFCTFK